MRSRIAASGKPVAPQPTQTVRAARRRGVEARGVWPGVACVASLLAVRLASAALNTVHDCDEVYNYWEPLHNLLHGFGLQTWEHSPQFALRSYLYLLLHALFAAPASLVLGADSGKRLTFHALRGVLGVACALAEAALCRAVACAGGRRLGLLLWALLLISSGMFTSSTTLLPSTFTMVAFTAGAALSLSRRPKTSVAVCVAGGLLGWPFAGLAAVPLGVHALWVAGLLPTLTVAALTALSVLLPSAACDVLFYGRTTVSVWNLVRYNVFGGGQSALYGTEGPLYYARNLFNAFNLALLLAPIAPLVEVSAAYANSRRPRVSVLVVIAPLFLWLGAMSTVPHKEERFAYVVYTQVCLSAALALDAFIDLCSCRRSMAMFRHARRLATVAVWVAVAGMAMLSAFRTWALLGYYFAPMHIFAQLPAAPAGTTTVCMGDEWHRFPSSFYLPGKQYRLGFVETGFKGLLPLPFDQRAGGTRHAPRALNDRNEAVPEQHVRNPGSTCAYWVGLETETPPAGARWIEQAAAPFLDAARSPALWRAFRVPFISANRNTFTRLLLLRNEKAG